MPAETNEIEERLAIKADGSTNSHRALRNLKDYGAALFSLDALMDSVQVLYVSRDPLQADLRPDGRLHSGQLQRWAKDDGFNNLFVQKHVQFLQGQGRKRQVLAPITEGEGFEAIQAVLNVARAKGLKLVMAVQPVHASRLELFDHLGYWAEYEQWKRVLARQVAQARATGIDAVLWDFGGYESYVQEPVPPPGDRHTAMKWFWDPVHSSAALGSLLVSRMLLPDSEIDFGQTLTPANVDAHLARIRQDRDAYRTRQPGQVQQVRKIFCSVRDCDGRAVQQVAVSR